MNSLKGHREQSMQRKLLSGLFWVLLANLLVKPFWILGIEVGVQNAVGNEAYGFYYAIFSFSYIFNILLDLGLTNFNTRNIAQHPQLIGKHLSGILGIKLLLLGLYVVVIPPQQLRGVVAVPLGQPLLGARPAADDCDMRMPAVEPAA